MSSPSRILVTGGSGFIGTNLVEHYLRTGVEVRNLDSRPPRNPAHQANWVECDILHREKLAGEVRKFRPTHLFHMAARTDLKGAAIADYPANTEGTSNIIAACAALPGLQRVLFASSRMVCRIGYTPQNDHDYCPSTPYGASKVEGERLVRKAADRLPDWLIARPTSIWGPWFDVPYRTFFDAIAAGRYFHPAGRRVRKSFGYVGNTVWQLDRLMFADPAAVRARTFYLCDNPPLEVLSFAELIRHEFAAAPVRSIPIALLRPAAWAGDLLNRVGVRNPPLTSFRLNNLLTEMLYDTADLDAVCGPPPISLTDGVRATAAWMRAPSTPH